MKLPGYLCDICGQHMPEELKSQVKLEMAKSYLTYKDIQGHPMSVLDCCTVCYEKIWKFISKEIIYYHPK